MAEGTVDNLNIQVSADAKRATDSLNALVTTINSVNNAFSKEVSGMRKFSKEVGVMTQSLKTLGGIKISSSNFSKISKSLKEIKTDGAKESAKDIKNVVDSLSSLGKVDFNESGVTKLTNSLRRLAQVDLTKFNVSAFKEITSAVSTLEKMPDVSSSVNRLVSSLSRLANAGEKTTQSANSILKLGQQTKEAAKQLQSVGTINDDVNLFVQSIGRLASAGDKTSQTASGLSALSKETLEFFKAMQSAPKVSENTIRMTQALAQLASAGGKVGSSTNTITSAFNKLSSIGNKTMSVMKKVASGITSAFTQIGNSSGGLTKAQFSLSNLLKTAVGFRLGYGLLNFGKQAFQLGSDITEVENVVDVAFGSMAQKAYDFASTATEQFGLSELAAKQYSGTMMAVLNASGVAQDQAAEMSTTLAGLAGDLASFYNISQDDAWTKIMSAMAGEVEPMRRLGVSMTVANLEAYALANGITESYQAMTQAEQQMLRYNYMMDATAQQQGDFARTSGTWANQIRLLTLNIQQLAATIGQGLISAVLPAVTALNKLFAVLQKAATAVRNFFYVLTGYEGGGSSGIVTDIASGMEDVESASGGAASGIGDAADAAENLKDQLTLLPFDQINKLSDTSIGDAGSSGGGAGSGIGDGGLGGIDDSLSDIGGKEPEKYVNAWAERIRKAFLAEDWEQLGYEIADGLNAGLQKVYDVISWKNVGPKITAFTTAFTETFNSFAENFDFELLGRTIGTGINTIVNTLNQLIDEIDWINLGRRFSAGFNGLVDEVNWFELGRLIGNKFMIAWDTLLGIVTTLDWGAVGRSLADGFNGMLSEISLGDIGTTIGTIVAGIIEMFREFFANADWSEVAKQLKEGISNALSAASDGGKNDGIIASLIGIGAIAGLAKIITPIITAVDGLSKALGGSGLAKSVGTALKGIAGKSGLSGVFTALKTAIGGISAPVTIAVAAIASIVLGIKDLWKTSETFRENVSEMWDKISDAFVSAKEKIWDDALVPLGENISDFFSSIYDFYEASGIKKAFEWIVTFIGDVLTNNISVAINVIGTAFGTAINIVSDLLSALSGAIDFVTGIFTGDWDKAWSGVEKIVDGVVDAIADLFSGLWETIQNIFSPVVEFFSDTFQGAYKRITDAFKSIGKWFSDKWNSIETVFSPVAQTFKNWFVNAYTNVKNAWSNANTWFSNKWGQIKTVFSPVASNFKTWFSNAYTNVKNAWGSANTWFKDKWTSIKNVFGDVPSFFKSGFQKAYDSVKSIWSGIGSYFKKIANNIISPIEKAVNGIISGVNWVLKKVGSKTRLSSWSAPKFASGSKGLQRDTFGVVNDQKGATYKELIVPPRGNPFIPKGRNVMLPLQKGTKIMPAKQTKDLMESMGVPHFKNGIGDFISGAWNAVRNFTGDIFDYLTNPGDIVKVALDKFMNLSSLVEPWLSVAGGIANTVFGGIKEFIGRIFDDLSVGKIEKAIQWALNIAADNTHGYDQASRWGPNYDCSSFVISAFEKAGIKLKSAGATYTGNMYSAAKSVGFKDVTGSVSRSSQGGLKRGDILLNRAHHTAIYLGKGRIVQASSNEFGKVTGGKSGDQTGREIYSRSYYNYPWNDVLRFSGKYKDGIGKVSFSDLFGKIPKLARGGLIQAPTLTITGERYRKEAVLPLENRRTMRMVADSIVDSSEAFTGLSKEEIQQAVAQGVAMAMMNNNNNNQSITVYAELKTENDEVLARAVTRGQQKIDYRFNSVPQMG